LVASISSVAQLAANLDRVSQSQAASPDLGPQDATAPAAQPLALPALPAGPGRVMAALPVVPGQAGEADAASLGQDAAGPESEAKLLAARRLEALPSLEGGWDAVGAATLGPDVVVALGVPEGLDQAFLGLLGGPGRVRLESAANLDRVRLGYLGRLDGLVFQERHHVEGRCSTRWRYGLMPFYECVSVLGFMERELF
jgi:hypothetical protein